MSILKNAFSGFYRNYFFTFISQMFALLLAVGALKLAAISFDGHSFGLYNIVRRVITLLNYPLLIGLGISIPIFVAKGRNNHKTVAPYISTALVFWLLSTILLFVINFIAGKNLAFFLFNEDKSEFTLPLILCFSSLYLYTILYAVYRGEQLFNAANLFQIIASGIIPIISILVSGHSVFYFLYFMGGFWLVADIFVLLNIYNRNYIELITFQKFKSVAKEILRFGLPRVPGEFALFGLMSFPLFYIAKYGSFEKAGYVAVGFTLVQLVASFFEFAGTLLLPKTTIMVADGDFVRLQSVVKKMMLFAFSGAVFISAFIFFNLQWILNLLDKSKFLNGVGEIKVVIFSIPFYIIYIILRNPIDAIDSRPYNTYNLVVCFIIQMGILLFGHFIFNFATIYMLSVALPLLFLGIFTIIRWLFILKKRKNLE